MSDPNREADDDDDAGAKKKRGGRGCLAIMFLLGVASLGGGIYLMNMWDQIGGGGKAGSVVLVVLGTLLLLPILLILVLNLVLRIFVGKITSAISKMGDDIVGNTRKMYDTIHEFRDADEDDFTGLDRGFYESTQRAMEDRGFRHLGDIVDETIEEVQNMTVPIRVMTSADGTTHVGFYHAAIQAPHLPGQKLQIYDLSCEFSDGEFMLTSNTAETDLMTPPPQMHYDRRPLATTLEEMLSLHETRKQQMLAAKAANGVTCIVVNTLEEALASERRQQVVKNAFRKDIGFVDPQEVRRIAATIEDDDDDEDSGELRANIAARAADEARKRQAD